MKRLTSSQLRLLSYIAWYRKPGCFTRSDRPFPTHAAARGLSMHHMLLDATRSAYIDDVIWMRLELTDSGKRLIAIGCMLWPLFRSAGMVVGPEGQIAFTG